MENTWDARFWEKVERRGPDECWPWTACLSGGYGLFGIGGSGNTTRAHRVSWTIAYGPIPAGALVLHSCDNRRCVNPAHLFLGDHAANMADMWSKERQRGAPRMRNASAKLTEEQITEIRRRWLDGETQSALAREFPVGQSHISRIVRGANWR